MAKLLRLFPDSIKIHHSDADYQGYFRIAQLIEKDGPGGDTELSCFQTMSFEKELNRLSISQAL